LPAVALELALTGASRAHPAAEALEVLPHAAHAREVVLELRQLDLELSLGRDGVLREDVQDELRPVDDAYVERGLEAPGLARLEVVVDDDRFGARVLHGALHVLELALPDVGPRVGCAPVLDELAHGLDARGAHELPQLRELVLGLTSGGERRDHEPALGLGPARGIRLLVHPARIMPCGGAD
jgi:hypothetical protein